jgi:hypothetical protein
MVKRQKEKRSLQISLLKYGDTHCRIVLNRFKIAFGHSIRNSPAIGKLHDAQSVKSSVKILKAFLKPLTELSSSSSP